MTQVEKLALRLQQFPNRLVTVLAFVDASGALVFWVVDEDKKVEGVNSPARYNCDMDSEKKESGKG